VKPEGGKRLEEDLQTEKAEGDGERSGVAGGGVGDGRREKERGERKEESCASVPRP